MKSLKKLLVCMVSVFVVVGLVGCTSDGTYMNSATDTTKEDGVVDELIDDVVDGVEDTVDDVEEGADDMIDDTKEGAEDLTDDVENGMDDLTEYSDDTMDGTDDTIIE